MYLEQNIEIKNIRSLFLNCNEKGNIVVAEKMLKNMQF